MSDRLIGGLGIYHKFASERIERSLERGYSKIVTRTQNPNIEIIVRESLDILVRKGNIKKTNSFLDAQDAKNLDIKGYDFEREHVRSVYGRRLTDEIPLSKNKEVNSIYSRLNYDLGDAFRLTFNLRR